MLNAPDQFKADCNNHQPYWSVAAVLLRDSGYIEIDGHITWAILDNGNSRREDGVRSFYYDSQGRISDILY